MPLILLILIMFTLLLSIVFYQITVQMRRKFSDNKAMPFIPFVIVFSVLCNIVMLLVYGVRRQGSYGLGIILYIIMILFSILLLSSIIGVELGLKATGQKNSNNDMK